MLPLVAFVFAFLATATAQLGDCDLKDLFTGGTLEKEMAEALLGGRSGPTLPVITVLRNHTVCLSVGRTRGKIGSISLVVEYNCTGSVSCPSVENATELFDFGCTSDGQWSHVLFYDYTHGRTPNATANFDTPPRMDCGVCFPVNPAPNPPTIDPVTHCQECEGCSDFGQSACYGTDSSECCSVYVNDMCASACPSPSDVIDVNFSCSSTQSTTCSSNDALLAVTVILIIVATLLATSLVTALIAVYRLYGLHKKYSNISPSNGQPNVKNTFYQSNEAYDKVQKSELQEAVSCEELQEEQERRTIASESYSEVKVVDITSGDDSEDYVN